MKVSELSGMLLDYWVARCSAACTDLSFERRDDHIVGIVDLGDEKVVCVFLHGGNVLKTISLRQKYRTDQAACYSPSRDWGQGGPIIDDSAIGFHPLSDAEWMAEEHITARTGRGPTPLIAAMRAYVASKFGDEVPDEEAA